MAQSKHTYSELHASSESSSRNGRVADLPMRTDHICCWQCGFRMQSASSSSAGDVKDAVVQCLDCVLPGKHGLQLNKTHPPQKKIKEKKYI